MANHRRKRDDEATLLYLERLRRTNPSPAVLKVIEQIEDELEHDPARPMEQPRHAVSR